jgi:hypothetical protein
MLMERYTSWLNTEREMVGEDTGHGMSTILPHFKEYQTMRWMPEGGHQRQEIKACNAA